MKLASIVKTIHGQYGTSPWAYVNAFYYTFFRINKFIVFEFDLRSENLPLKASCDYQFTSLSLEDLRYLREQITYPREFYMDSIGGLKSNQVLLKNGQLVYIHWLRFPGDVGRFTRLKTGTVEITHLFTLPSERGKGLARVAVAATMSMLKTQGFNKLIAIVHKRNISSIKTFEAVRFKPVQYLTALGQFNFKIDI
jgi:GNAT superfamily N-acetyltransferase